LIQAERKEHKIWKDNERQRLFDAYPENVKTLIRDREMLEFEESRRLIEIEGDEDEELGEGSDEEFREIDY
jgi:hypothetical protein